MINVKQNLTVTMRLCSQLQQDWSNRDCNDYYHLARNTTHCKMVVSIVLDLTVKPFIFNLIGAVAQDADASQYVLKSSR